MIRSGWRLAIAVVTLLAVSNGISTADQLVYFTFQSNILVGYYFLWAAGYPLLHPHRVEPPGAGVRGAVTLYIVITGTVYNTLLAPAHYTLDDFTLHVMVPLLVLADWFLVGRNQVSLRRWHPLLWLGYPLAYLAFALVRGAYVHSYPYYFIDPRELGTAGLIRSVLGLLAYFALLGYLLRGLGRRRVAVWSRRRDVTVSNERSVT